MAKTNIERRDYALAELRQDMDFTRASRVTGVPIRTLRYWAKQTGVTPTTEKPLDEVEIIDTNKTFLERHEKRLHQCMELALDNLITALGKEQSARDSAIIAKAVASIIKDFTITQDESVKANVSNLIEFCIQQSRR